MTRAIAAALCGLVLTVSAGGAQQPPSRPVDAATATAVRKLLAATGATKLMINNLESMIASQRQNNPQSPRRSGMRSSRTLAGTRRGSSISWSRSTPRT